MTPIRSTLPETDLKVVAETLQDTLADLIDLSLTAKQAHWNIVGPRFRSVHLQLDEVVSLARGYTDTVAERISALGVSPDGRAATVARSSSLPEYTSGWVSDDDTVQAMVRALGELVARMRDRIAATAGPDPVTQDLFIGLTAELEKQHWMFQAQTAE